MLCIFHIQMEAPAEPGYQPTVPTFYPHQFLRFGLFPLMSTCEAYPPSTWIRGVLFKSFIVMPLRSPLQDLTSLCFLCVCSCDPLSTASVIYSHRPSICGISSRLLAQHSAYFIICYYPCLRKGPHSSAGALKTEIFYCSGYRGNNLARKRKLRHEVSNTWTLECDACYTETREITGNVCQ